MPQVQLNEKVVKVLQALMTSQKKKIRESFENTKRIEVGNINNFEITNVHSHKGFGGTTYIVSANMSTAHHGMIPGGMVIKFPNNLEDEELNAMALHKLCVKRQKQWDKLDVTTLDPLIKHLPSTVFAPAVIETVNVPNTDITCLMLEFVDNAVPLVDATQQRGVKKVLHLLGYALARLHGTVSFRTNMDIYRPIFRHLANTGLIESEVLDNWTAVFKESKGSVEFIHGDSHLMNILKTGVNSLAWIDAMLVQNSDRMDDVGYALSYMIQKDISDFVNKGVEPNTIIRTISENVYNNWAISIIETYNATINLDDFYRYSPIDFFVGAHCIIRSDLWDSPLIKWCLNEIGKYFIYNWPINKVLGLI
jgi:hypothetical protein